MEHLYYFLFLSFPGWTPLHEASSEGFNDVIIELLKAGANVNCENVDGMLPLHGAAVGNHLKVMTLVISGFYLLRETSGINEGILKTELM